MLPAAIPILLTPRLRLRPLHLDDATALHAAYGDPEVMRFWSLLPSRDLAETRQRIEMSLSAPPESHAAWAVVVPPHDRLAGLVNYHHHDPRHRRLEIGYLMARAHWRQGYMREAVTALLDHCFGTLGAHRAEATVEPENTGSRRLLESLGFICESEPMRGRMLVGDSFRALLMYGLLAPDWAARGPRR